MNAIGRISMAESHIPYIITDHTPTIIGMKCFLEESMTQHDADQPFLRCPGHPADPIPKSTPSPSWMKLPRQRDSS
eukprot:scaffold2573_cov202-Ochromonas_danica.AAC.4